MSKEREATMDTNDTGTTRLPEKVSTPQQTGEILPELNRTDGTRTSPPQEPAEGRRDFGGEVTPKTPAPDATIKLECPKRPAVYQINLGTDDRSDMKLELLREQPGRATRKLYIHAPPKFDGRHPRHWLDSAERYYDFMEYTEKEKLFDAIIKLEGKDLTYWCSVENSELPSLPVDWEGFKAFMLDCCSGWTVGATIRRLQQIKYKGDVEEVAKQFAEVLAEGESPSPEMLKDLFLSIFPHRLVAEVIEAEPANWIQARKLLRRKVGKAEENALRWYLLASDELRREATDYFEHNKAGWVSFRGFMQEQQAYRDLGGNRGVPRQEYGTRRDPVSERRMQSDRQDVIKCYACGGEGHKARKCPNAIMSAKKEGQRCRRCGGIGHWATACPTKTDYKHNTPRELALKEAKVEAATFKRRGKLWCMYSAHVRHTSITERYPTPIF